MRIEKHKNELKITTLEEFQKNGDMTMIENDHSKEVLVAGYFSIITRCEFVKNEIRITHEKSTFTLKY